MKVLLILIFGVLPKRVCRGEGSSNLLVLRNILITFAAFNPGKELNQTPDRCVGLDFEHLGLTDQCVCDSEVSYAQGMNDLCSRFLEVLDSEVDTFWSFSCYMERFNKDFMADGLQRKIGGLHSLGFRFYLQSGKEM